MRIVIVGGGIAAAEAAIAARAQSPDAEIIILSAELTVPYRRPALSRMLYENLSDAQLYFKSAEFYSERRIELRLNHPVRKINPANRSVELENGEKIPFDKLLLAVGSNPFVPPLTNPERRQVLTLRTLDDCMNIRKLPPDRTAVIGGGLLGLELAEGLLKLGFEVTVVESCPRLLARQLDEASSVKLLEKLQSYPGLKIIVGDAPEAIDRDGVRLASGLAVPVRHIFAAAGVRPQTELAAAAGLQVGRGITVDEFMQSSIPGIFAAGDCAELNRRTWGLFAPAQAMGRAAGSTMAGTPEAFGPAGVYPARLNSLGIKLFSAGCITGTPQDFSGGKGIKKLFYADDRLVGGILMDDLSDAVALQEAIAKGASRAESRESFA